MRLPLREAGNQSAIDTETGKEMVAKFLERGFTFFDTAYMYHEGKSEVFFKEAVLDRFPRESFTVTDKMPAMMLHHAHDLERICHEQVERTRVTYYDYYWLHALNKNTVKTLDEIGGWEFMKKLKAEGKVRHIGFSFHDDSATLEQILGNHPEMEFVQLQINYIDWENPGVESRRCYELATKYGKPVIAMEPVKGGSLAQVPQEVKALFEKVHPTWSPASWAIGYVASLPNVMMVLSGMSNMEQLDDNTRFMQDFTPLNEEEQNVIAQAVGLIRKTIAIDCTACHYCTEGCPRHIAIPEYFSMMNTLKQFEKAQKGNTRLYYNRLSEKKGKAGDCIECGQCETVCPQHLPIIDNLKLVAETFE